MILSMLNTVINKLTLTVTSLRISAWNANSLNHHAHEIILFLNKNKIDNLLLSESHTIKHTLIEIPHYTIYYTNHSYWTAYAASVIITKFTLVHYEIETFITNKIQALFHDLKPYHDQW
jgi:uncharacterized protein YdaL